MFTWIRSIIERNREPAHPRKFVVEVSIDHPRIIPHVVTGTVIIDAHDRQHALRQLKEECKITLGRCYVLTKK